MTKVPEQVILVSKPCSCEPCPKAGDEQYPLPDWAFVLEPPENDPYWVVLDGPTPCVGTGLTREEAVADYVAWARGYRNQLEERGMSRLSRRRRGHLKILRDVLARDRPCRPGQREGQQPLER